MKKGYWTAPYCGVSHYVISGGPRPQFTIEERRGFVVAYVLGIEGFTSIREEVFEDVPAARCWIEEQAEALR